METILRLAATDYANALKAVRDANEKKACVEVAYATENEEVEVSRYFLKFPNFELNAYAIGGTKYTLDSYQHVSKFPNVAKADLAAALSKGGEHGTEMNDRLSVVVCLICEAARSEPIERAMQKAIAGERVDLARYRVLMNMYEHTLEFKRATNAAATLLPLQLQDYIDYVQSKAYTGGKNIADTIRALQ
ncbi:hypothetical protein [Xanthomonas sp. 3058]|uniref:hypothetical protein n=1 Tax=Xanthomonas sp. 3058 TaxID=3035314 RepID=UPI001611D1B6|nr:hypothetical protein [Xanthomonas sp. 3058]MBB5862465.1 hypothetical protein [Xanthomonas sp. 3058]